MHKIAVFYFLGWVLPVSAIVVQIKFVAEASPSAAGLDLNYSYSRSSTVALGGAWILTAGLVADYVGSDSLTIDGCVYTQQAVVWTLDPIALVRCDKTLPGYYDL